MARATPLAVLISGRGTNMLAIARACAEGRIGARIACVVADREGTPGIAHARALGLASRVLGPGPGPGPAGSDRAAFESELAHAIDASGATLVALAGFMRILSATFVARYAGRLLNVHPSLLPKYRGLDTHRRALEAGERVHGASVHYVMPELDGGPIIHQARLSVRPGEDAGCLAARVLACEHVIYPRVIGWIAAGRLAWDGAGPRLDGEALGAPLVEDFDEL